MAGRDRVADVLARTDDPPPSICIRFRFMPGSPIPATGRFRRAEHLSGSVRSRPTKSAAEKTGAAVEID